jgi:hypothetical protein
MSLILDFSSIEDSPQITKEFILSKISQIDIIEYYIKQRIDFTKTINSPLRKDSNPSFTFKQYADGGIIGRDWSYGENYDCFRIVQELYRCSFVEALKIIANDFKLLNPRALKGNPVYINHSDTLETKILPDRPATIKKPKIITIQPHAFTKTDVDYWGGYGIEIADLVKFSVKSCKYVWLNGDLIRQYSTNNPVYAYEFTGYGYKHYKVYCPLADRKKKWLFSGTSEDIEGYELLPLLAPYVVITKSLKDVIVLYKYGVPAISLQGEGNKLEISLLDKLKRRFENIITFYDNDDAGIKGANKIQKDYNIPYILIPSEYKCKDISDFRLEYGDSATRDLLVELNLIK